MRCLIDGDIVLYRAAFSAEKEGTADDARRTADEIIAGIVGSTRADKTSTYLTGSGNFRKQLYPEYKANRVQPKPKYYDEVRRHLIDNQSAIDICGMEADDQLAIEQLSDEDQTVICSIDKDLLQISGLHYNFVKQEFKQVTALDGMLHFYRQLLMGDRVDNIPGLTGIGEVKANKIMNPAHQIRMSTSGLYKLVLSKYEEEFKEKGKEMMELYGNLLWIVRELKEDGTPMMWTDYEASEL